MRFLREIGILCFCTLMAGGAFADTGASDTVTIPLSSKVTGCELIDQDLYGYHFRLAIGQLQAQKINTSAGDFIELSIPGFFKSGDIGGPQLPSLQRLLALPYGADIQVEIEATHTREVDLAAYGLTDRLAPAQAPVPKNRNPDEREWIFNAEAYAVDRVAPELGKVVPLGKLRALRLGRLEVSPVTYLPEENKLLVTDQIEVRIAFTGGDPVAEKELQTSTASPFFAPVYAAIQGADSRGHFPVPKAEGDPASVEGLVTMVIVTPGEYVAHLTEFVNWKIQRGFLPIVAEIGSADVGATAESIKQYITDLYLEGTTSQPAPTFVVLVGDVDQVPTFTIGSYVTDRPYCDIDDDNIPDIFYGRLPAANTTELDAMLDKTITYDKCTMGDLSESDLDYLEEATLVAGSDAYHAPSWGNGQINYGTTYYFNDDYDIDCYAYLYPESSSQADLIIQTVDLGVGFINYTAHAGVSGWSNPGFSISDVNDLTNINEYCFVIGNCCSSADFSLNSFGEAWLRVPNAGGIGYVGATSLTYWDQDFYWAVGNTQSIVANPDREDTGPGVYDRLFADPAVGGNIVSGAVNFFGNLAVQESPDTYDSHDLYWDIYHLMGDPSLNIHLGVPEPNTVTLPEEVLAEDGYIDLTATPGSYVGLSQTGVLIGGGTVSPSGHARIRFVQMPEGGQDLSVVVTVQNMIPFSRYIPVRAAEELVLRSIYPNPVQFGTQASEVPLWFRTTSGGVVTLRVFDLSGRLVREIANGTLAAGEHPYAWDGLDDAGRTVASGTYLVHLNASGTKSSQPITVIR